MVYSEQKDVLACADTAPSTPGLVPPRNLAVCGVREPVRANAERQTLLIYGLSRLQAS